MQVRVWLSDEGVKLEKASSSSHMSPDITNYNVGRYTSQHAMQVLKANLATAFLYQATILL